MKYTIKQFAKKFSVSEHTVRYYTDIGLLPCKRDSGNRRVFDDESANWMQGICCLKGCGASIEDIKEYCCLCLLPESTDNLKSRYNIILKQRDKAYIRLREAQATVGYMETRSGIMRRFCPACCPMTPIRKNGRKAQSRKDTDRECFP